MTLELLITDEAICTDKHPSDPEAKVVKCNTAAAAFQLVGANSPISKEDADRFGVKTKPAEQTNYTLRLDSHTIARTPEEKAYAATQPQPGLVMAQAEGIRAAAALSVQSLQAANAAKFNEAAEEAKKADDAANKKLKATLENKSTTKRAKKATKAKAPRAKKAEAKKADEPKPSYS